MSQASDTSSETNPTVSESVGDRLVVSARSLPRRRFFNDMPDKGLFGFVAVFGFVLIIALKLREFDADFIAVLAVAFMVAYGLIAYRIQAVQLRLDRLGDNFYYLGFIYTLASMSAALLQLRGGADIQSLLGSFGIALFTTIVGIAGRVLFVQMRSEIDEVEAHVRRDLLAASNDLRAQLSLSLREFETFHTSVRQTAGEISKESFDATKTHRERMESATRAAADHIKAAFEANEANARRLGEVLQQISKMVGELSERLVKQTQSVDAELEVLLLRLKKAGEEFQRAKRGRRRWYWPFRRY